jgi:tetratricopeptide (TPR) repeat protein
MKKYLALTVITALGVCISQAAAPKGGKENEANRFAREGAEAAKSQDLDKAVDLLRKATNMDHKYADELSAVYQRRAYALAQNQNYQEAIQDYSEAIKIQPKDPRIYEQRAAVEMKTYDYDKALADYSELIKLKPNEIRYLNYRAYVYEVKDDLQNSLADTEKVLKQDSNNQEAKGRKQRLDQKLAERMPLTPPPGVSSPKPSPSPARKKKP